MYHMSATRAMVGLLLQWAVIASTALPDDMAAPHRVAAPDIGVVPAPVKAPAPAPAPAAVTDLSGWWDVDGRSNGGAPYYGKVRLLPAEDRDGVYDILWALDTGESVKGVLVRAPDVDVWVAHWVLHGEGGQLIHCMALYRHDRAAGALRGLWTMVPGAGGWFKEDLTFREPPRHPNKEL